MTFEFKEATFKVDRFHLKLVQASNISWGTSYGEGNVEVDAKRPYGDSSRIAQGILQILEVPPVLSKDDSDDGEDHWSNDHLKKAMKYHRDTEVLFEIFVHNLELKEGTYHKGSNWDDKWEYVG